MGSLENIDADWVCIADYLVVRVTTTDALGHLIRIIAAQREDMGDVGLARHEPALLPPCQTISFLSYSNCQRSTHYISKLICT